MNKEFTYGNDGYTGRNDGTSRSQHFSSTFSTQENYSHKINEGSLSEPSYFSPNFKKPHLDIYSSNRYLDTFLFHRSSYL